MQPQPGRYRHNLIWCTSQRRFTTRWLAGDAASPLLRRSLNCGVRLDSPVQHIVVVAVDGARPVAVTIAADGLMKAWDICTAKQAAVDIRALS